MEKQRVILAVFLMLLVWLAPMLIWPPKPRDRRTVGRSDSVRVADSARPAQIVKGGREAVRQIDHRAREAVLGESAPERDPGTREQMGQLREEREARTVGFRPRGDEIVAPELPRPGPRAPAPGARAAASRPHPANAAR